MKNKIFQILTLFLVFASCETHYGKYNGFEIYHESGLQKYIISNSYDTLSISRGDSRVNILPYPGSFIIFHNNNGSTDTLFCAKGSIVIDSFVNNVKSDSNYIIVDQKPLDLIFGIIESNNSENYRRLNFPNNYNDIKRMLKESTIHRYWIININTKEIYGGYKKEDFDLILKVLNIPNELNF